MPKLPSVDPETVRARRKAMAQRFMRSANFLLADFPGFTRRKAKSKGKSQGTGTGGRGRGSQGRGGKSMTPFVVAGPRHHGGKAPPTQPMLRRASKSKGKGRVGGTAGGESDTQKPLRPLTPREALDRDLKSVLRLRDHASDRFRKRKLNALRKAMSAARAKAKAAAQTTADLKQSPSVQSNRRMKKPRPGGGL